MGTTIANVHRKSLELVSLANAAEQSAMNGRHVDFVASAQGLIDTALSAIMEVNEQEPAFVISILTMIRDGTDAQITRINHNIRAAFEAEVFLDNEREAKRQAQKEAESNG